MLENGRFVTFDGVDGSGKTTIMRTVESVLREQGYAVQTFKAIGEGVHGLALRNFLLNMQEADRMNPLSEALVFLGAINDAYESAVKPFIEEGGIALMDRWVFSTYTYQWIAAFHRAKSTSRGEHIYEQLDCMKAVIRVMPVPDLSVIVSVNKETMLTNIGERGAENNLDNFCVKYADDFLKCYADIPTSPGFELYSSTPRKHLTYYNNDRPYLRAPDVDWIVRRILDTKL